MKEKCGYCVDYVNKIVFGDIIIKILLDTFLQNVLLYVGYCCIVSIYFLLLIWYYYFIEFLMLVL